MAETISQTLPKITAFKKDVNPSGYADLTRNLEARSLANGVYTVVLEYDFTVDGAIAASGGKKSLRPKGSDTAFALPTGAHILNAYYKVTTTFTSATDAATLGLGIDTDDEDGTLAGADISAGGNAWDATDKVTATIQTGAAANVSEITTAERAFVIKNTDAAEATTAGAVTVILEYTDL